MPIFTRQSYLQGHITMMRPICMAVCLNLLLGLTNGVLEKSKNIEINENLMKDLFQQYDYFLMPPNGIPIPVKIGMYVTGISHISEFDMEFTLIYYFRSLWMDDRLQFNPQKYGNISKFILHPKRIEQLWKPGIFFRNERGRSISDDSSHSYFFCQIRPNGQVFLSKRLETTFRYEMDLQNYPFDTQYLTIDASSYSFTTDILNVTWSHNHAVDVDKDLDITGFRLIETKTRKDEDEVTPNGSFPRLKLIFSLKRYVSFYILQVMPINFGSLCSNIYMF